MFTLMRRTVVHLVLGWSLVGLIFLTGCGREDSPVAAVSESEEGPAGFGQTNDSNGASTRAAEAGQRNFSVPFGGIIRAKEERDLLVNDWETTYTIGDRKIRREAECKAPLGRLGHLGQGSLGIICDLPSDHVLLYRTGEGKKLFARMTVKEFEALARAGGSASRTRQALPSLAARPSVWKHIGTFFADFPLSNAEVINVPEARTVKDLPCDLYTARARSIVIEVSHCQRIRVERNLLSLVELDLPAEVTGFPLLMRRLQLVPVSVADANASKARRLLRNGAEWAGKAAERAMRRRFELLEIAEHAPPDSAFMLDANFVECPGLEELHRQFQPPEGHHDDWD